LLIKFIIYIFHIFIISFIYSLQMKLLDILLILFLVCCCLFKKEGFGIAGQLI